ncbi:NADPH-dependent F420 reductase [Streptomyces sp. NPDC059215]|uniref:NADPH-dependent F420 reductase n=1 Tax=Streptomyces sp. NPDC059215 TaxID=3346772 RepID=UPI0036B51272
MTDAPTLGILGTGPVGKAVATKAVRAGWKVVLGNSRGPEALKSFVEDLGPNARAGSAAEAAAQETVLLCIPFLRVPEVTSLTDWSGKIVIDATNQYATTGPYEGRADIGDVTGSEWIASHLPGARIVKSLNTMYASFIEADPEHEEGRQVAFYAGDDGDAKGKVGTLLGQLGFAPIDLGGLVAGGRLMQLDGALSGQHFLLQPV